MKSPSTTAAYLAEASRLRKMAEQLRDQATQMLAPNASGHPQRLADRHRRPGTVSDGTDAIDA